LDETIWSLTSPRVKHISGSRNFRSPPQKDFCNNICHKRSFHNRSLRIRSDVDHLAVKRRNLGWICPIAFIIMPDAENFYCKLSYCRFSLRSITPLGQAHLHWGRPTYALRVQLRKKGRLIPGCLHCFRLGWTACLAAIAGPSRHRTSDRTITNYLPRSEKSYAVSDV
jgi:hypothetical protein